MFRDRTNLFLSYRRTFPHVRSVGALNQDPFSDLESAGNEESYPMVSMDTNKAGMLPPQFMDFSQKIDENLESAESKMLQLTRLYRKNALPGFEDKSSDEKEIEELSYQTIKGFQVCFNIIKQVETVLVTQRFRGQVLSRSDIVVLENLKKNCANRIQASSNKFRVLQNNYLKFLNKDDFKPLPSSSEDKNALVLLEEQQESNATTQQEIDSYSRQTLQRQNQQQVNVGNTAYLQRRDEEITQLARGVLEVSTIFREMQNLVIDQGTIVDRIDYNLENTVIELKGAQRELERASGYQKRTQKCKVILLLSLSVMVLFFFVMLKPHRGSSGSSPKIDNPPPTPDVSPVEPENPETNDPDNED
ncbi:LAMI_0A06546g1_1 [Lachancea mirantina]|uniref:LAMI_0A06546g1_1 n=1 Tax=Lachancea mirantina TaxID=1230905 RepID=A0A1G4IQC6_9SACH|nr:LAMI_0A06546g1_1 [Lachancea mirantina]